MDRPKRRRPICRLRFWFVVWREGGVKDDTQVSDLIKGGSVGGWTISANRTSTSLSSSSGLLRAQTETRILMPKAVNPVYPHVRQLLAVDEPGHGAGGASNLFSELELVLLKTVLPRRGHLCVHNSQYPQVLGTGGQ